MRRDATPVLGRYFGELIINKEGSVLFMMSVFTLYNFYLLLVWSRRSIGRNNGSDDLR